MFSIASLDDVFNAVPPHYDDGRVQQQVLLSREFSQLFPETIYGGRQVLWWCPRCATPWWQADHRLFVLRLSSEQAAYIGHQLHAPMRQDGTFHELPMRVCPDCLRAVCVIDTYPGRLGTQILWHALPNSTSTSSEPLPTNLGLVTTADRCTSARDTLPQAFLFAMAEQTPRENALSLAQIGDAMLTWQTDLPGELDAVAWQLRWIERTLPPPRADECEPLGTAHLARLAYLVEPAPGMCWQGFLWQPPETLSSALFTRQPLVLLHAVLLPQAEPTSIFHLYSLWQRLLPRVFEAAQWEEPRS
ncbi:hypothetical protein KSC_001410 [Ktedonobacter sp. SOSP1-52]|uniref:hypothetical protein n=1 Tax=Ktedonobacter sp. SOSP1-52 TaxID=2778366 RepID=UPI001914FDA6|nr:hypothetical protein [Ktedonobacter sp. SOSP1-52]GHO61249.1 hypothetical protein KSC_001410 [Ktedonobacter sp. SOSP1-52]